MPWPPWKNARPLVSDLTVLASDEPTVMVFGTNPTVMGPRPTSSTTLPPDPVWSVWNVTAYSPRCWSAMALATVANWAGSPVLTKSPPVSFESCWYGPAFADAKSSLSSVTTLTETRLSMASARATVPAVFTPPSGLAARTVTERSGAVP
ncbi:unannotated protein [freshwater metagenome]|uniref:Unannotated protein n=1 Tax=freshwater metagenome TaxID=449393 RepID=A0A6J7R1F0_9ZZZZ